VDRFQIQTISTVVQTETPHAALVGEQLFCGVQPCLYERAYFDSCSFTVILVVSKFILYVACDLYSICSNCVDSVHIYVKT